MQFAPIHRMTRPWLLCSVLVSAMASSALAGAPERRPPDQSLSVPGQLMRDALHRLHKEAPDDPTDEDPRWSRVEALYAARDYEPLFLTEHGQAIARVFVERMSGAADDGLDPADYDVARLRELARRFGPRPSAAGSGAESNDRLATGELHFTSTLLRFGTDLAHGPAAPGREPIRSVDVAGRLAGVRDVGTARAVMDGLDPPHPEYHRLREALMTYRTLDAGHSWSPLRGDLLLKREPSNDDEGSSARSGEERVSGAPGDDEPVDPDEAVAVERLCRRLVALGDLDQVEACARAERYDRRLEEAVRRFQARHGLIVDGIVGPQTVAALNVPLGQRVRQIIVNMNRWRQQPDEPGERHIRVNIAGFRLQAFEGGREALSMAVVVGTAGTPTPEMHDEITYLEFRPYWNVPESITHSELLPRILEDPDYLDEGDFDVIDGWHDPASVVDPATIDWTAVADDFPYRLRQRPGGQNALGLVKFMFPNDYSVYLHDTPADHRFEAHHRAFSHGCVRVEDPVSLARLLLGQTPEWSRDAIREAMAGGRRQVVPLPDAVPVYLTYFTAWVESDGVVHFRRDLYGRDAT